MSKFSLTLDGGEVLGEEDVTAYATIIERAFGVHVERDAVRRGLWKEYPAKDQFGQIKVKVERILRSLEIIDEMLKEGFPADSGLKMSQVNALKEEIRKETDDIINYATFGVRKLP